MTELIIAGLIMGLAGSLHCAGMCGPLVSIMPYNRSSSWKFMRTNLANHFGRISVYVLLGLLFGLAGQGIAAAGFQQWLSIVSGVLILLIVFWPSQLNWFSPKGLLMSVVTKLKTRFPKLIEKRNNRTLFVLGLINGLLPCGLVYLAVAASVSTGNALQSALFMFFFGIGTTPVLIAIAAMTTGIGKIKSIRFANPLKIFLVVGALLLIVRGSNLGIPYLSPKLSVDRTEMDCCHK